MSTQAGQCRRQRVEARAGTVTLDYGAHSEEQSAQDSTQTICRFCRAIAMDKQVHYYQADSPLLPRALPWADILALPDFGAEALHCPRAGHSLKPSVLVRLRQEQVNPFFCGRTSLRC